MNDSKGNNQNKVDSYAKEAAKEIFGNKKESDFDEDQLASGSEELLEKSDADRFPEELEEYTEEERRPKIVKKEGK